MIHVKPIVIDRKIKKAVLSRLFKHGYSVNTTRDGFLKRYCGYCGIVHPIQVTFHKCFVRIDRLFCCTLETGTATSINNEMLEDLLQTDIFDIKQQSTGDFDENTYAEIEVTHRGLGLIFYNKTKEEKTA